MLSLLILEPYFSSYLDILFARSTQIYFVFKTENLGASYNHQANPEEPGLLWVLPVLRVFAESLPASSYYKHHTEGRPRSLRALANFSVLQELHHIEAPRPKVSLRALSSTLGLRNAFSVL